MRRVKIMFLGMLFCILTLVTVGITYGWYMSTQFESLDGKARSAYFAGGDGSAESPYQIKTRVHIYNLAWLQYMGIFNETEEKVQGKTSLKQYYFEVADGITQIDMDNMAIPPIGTETYPFIGNFDGKNCVITNALVTNDVAQMTTKPNLQDFNKIGQIVGFFGVVGEGTTLQNPQPLIYDTAVNAIENFYLDNVIVESSSSQTLIGIVAGYLNGNAKNIGVTYSQIKLPTVGLESLVGADISSYGLVGYYDAEKINWEGKPGGGDLAYGGNFDADLMLKRLELIQKNGNASPYLPKLDTTGDHPSPASGNKMPLTVVPTTITDANYTGPNAKETVSSQNIGYYIGDKNKIVNQKINFGDKLITPSDMNADYKDSSGKTPKDSETTPRQFFTVKGPNGNYSQHTIQAMSDEDFANLPQNIQDLIPKENGEVEQETIRLLQRFPGSVSVNNTNQDDSWSYQGQISYFGETYGEAVNNFDKKGVCLPNNAIWFRPKNPGKLRFVMYSGSDGKSFKLIKITRNSATEDNPFAGEDISGNEVSELNTKNFPAYLLLYFEYDVTSQDIKDNVEFALYQGDGEGAYFVYMDIGINGTGSSTDFVGNIEDVDFVYDTELTIGDHLSSVLFSIKGTSTAGVVYYFRRKNEGTLDAVLYFIEPAESGLTLTPTGDKVALASDKDCNSKAP